MISRLKLDQAAEGLNFIIEAQKKMHGEEDSSDDLLAVVKFKHELSTMHLL